MMMNRQMYGKTFSSKKEFFKWLEENEDRIDWDYDVELGWYWKDDKETTFNVNNPRLKSVGLSKG